MYVQDVVGKGHKSKAGTPDSRRSIFVCTKPLDPELLAHGKTTYEKDYGESATGHYFPLTRVVDTPDGGSKFEDVKIPLDLKPIPNNFMSVVYPGYDVVFADRSGDSDFHVGLRRARMSDEPDFGRRADLHCLPWNRSISTSRCDFTLQLLKNAPRKHIVIILRGTLEIQTTDGEVRQFKVGDVLQNSDTEGRGHQTRAIGGPVLSMWIKTAH